MNSLAFDVIGDIHGQAGKLKALLKRMGYVQTEGTWRSPHGRQAVFLGDLIDRGPAQMEVLQIVRSMVDGGQARCIMGNHEFNAIGYVSADPARPGETLRPNLIDSPKARKNRAQHVEFLAQVGEGSPEHREWIRWFRTLPVALDLGGLRVVHGSWHEPAIQALAEAGWVDGKALDDALLLRAYDKSDPVQHARSRLTCGLEVDLPQGQVVLDKAGHEHKEVRIADWRYKARQFREVALLPEGNDAVLEGMDWPRGLQLQPIEGAPILIGHHWFQGTPKVESAKIACLDWSAAKGGPLVAYRWDGEEELSDSKLVWVQAR